MAGYQRKAGAPLSFSAAGFRAGARRVVVPCGQCRDCRLDRSRAWAVRILHEASLHEDNCFITLTYADGEALSLVPRDLQLFFKRLRERIGPFRFYACGEYGELRGRAHYHACLFGARFPDRYQWRTSATGFRLDRSPLLEGVWGLGSAEVGDVSFESAAYVARYIMKKQLGGGARREILDVTTGEVFEREHEFSRMSRKPGLASAWLTRFMGDVYPAGEVVVRGGAKLKPPKFYDNRFKSVSPAEYEELVARRIARADERFDDNSPSRLRVKAQVTKARVSQLKRTVE